MKRQLLFTAILSVLISCGVFAQEKGLKEKLKKVEGKAESIVIQTDKGTTTFSGDEADALMKMIKANAHGRKVIFLDGDDDFSWDAESDIDIDKLCLPLKKFKTLHGGALGGNIKVELSDLMDSLNPDRIHKKIVIQTRDGNKTVTVTTKENGTEKVEMFEGSDAEKYLEEHKSDIDKEETTSKGLKKKVKKIEIDDENKK